MNLVQPTIATIIDVARDLVKAIPFDGEVTVRLLDVMVAHDLDVQTLGAIKHARLIAASLQNEASQRTIAVARFALARVVMLLEPLVVPTCT